MSSRVEAKITCPHCGFQFPFTLYRSIWGEYPENRELVMSDKINVAKCSSCGNSTKLSYPFIYTNSKQFFAVWWEPSYDAQIDKDAEGYAKMLGENNYLATAPRIKNWNEFKNTIIKFENGELMGQLGNKSDEFTKKVEVSIKQILQNSTAKPKGGCSLIFLFILALSTVAISTGILF